MAPEDVAGSVNCCAFSKMETNGIEVVEVQCIIICPVFRVLHQSFFMHYPLLVDLNSRVSTTRSAPVVDIRSTLLWQSCVSNPLPGEMSALNAAYVNAEDLRLIAWCC
jgi:hypothetical protein